MIPRILLLVGVLLLRPMAQAAGAKGTDAAGTIAASDETATGKADIGTIAAGAFQPSWDSLARYECPDWFRDAKFGIFMHWGLPSVADESRRFGTGHYARLAGVARRRPFA